MPKSTTGFTLIEIVIASSIIVTSFVAILAAYSYIIRAEKNNTKLVKSIYLLEEGEEAVRYLRDKGWTANIASLSTSTNYYLYFSASGGVGTWQSTTTRQVYDGIFERKVTFGNLYRNNTTQDLSTSSAGAILDTKIRKVTVSVSWIGASGATTTRTLSTYLTNFNSN